jgi:hypothetical protein
LAAPPSFQRNHNNVKDAYDDSIIEQLEKLNQKSFDDETSKSRVADTSNVIS